MAEESSMKCLCSLLFLLCFPFQSFSLEKLNPDYLIMFGNPESKVQIVQYFSFMCPHCLELFREDFRKIQQEWLDNGKVSWIFHPVPMDLLTVQAMDCLEKLTEREKRIFLTVILDTIPANNVPLSVIYMQKAMEIFNKPLPDLKEKEYLSKTRAFQDAFLFIKQKEKIEVVPVVEINEHLFLNEVPSREFIKKHLEDLLSSSKNLKEDEDEINL
jgi:hypothetical protein